MKFILIIEFSEGIETSKIGIICQIRSNFWIFDYYYHQNMSDSQLFKKSQDYNESMDYFESQSLSQIFTTLGEIGNFKSTNQF